MRVLPIILLALIVSAIAHAREISGTRAERKAAAQGQKQNRQTLSAALGGSLDNIIGIELLTAGPYSGTFESRFGHTLLRFIDRDDDPFNDLVVGFEMVTIDGSRILQEGFDGQSAIAPIPMRMADILVNYYVDQQRQITRLILPTGNVERKLIAQEILVLAEAPSALGNYSFIKNNCDTAMMKLLSVAGFLVPEAMVDIPSFAPTRLKNASYAPYPIITLNENRHVVAIEKSTRFGLASQLQKIPRIELEAVWNSIEHLPPYDLEVLYHQWPAKWSTYKFRLAKLFLDRVKLRRPLKEIFNLNSIPEVLYSTCANDKATCIRNRAKAAEQVWTTTELAENAHTFLRVSRQEKSRALQLEGRRGRRERCRILQSKVIDNIDFDAAILSAFRGQKQTFRSKSTNSLFPSIEMPIDITIRGSDSCDNGN